MVIGEFISIGKLIVDILKYLNDKLTDEDQKIFRSLLRSLTDYRLLTSRNESEYAGGVIQSAERLRSLISSTVQQLSQNSQLEDGLLGLGATVRKFVTSIDEIERSIRDSLDLMVTNRDKHGIQPDKSSQEFLSHWERLGYPNQVLKENHRLNVMEITYPAYQHQFLMALGELRGQFGLVLSTLCEATAIELPQPLALLTPGIEKMTRRLSRDRISQKAPISRRKAAKQNS